MAFFVKAYNIEIESTIRPLLYSSGPIRLQANILEKRFSISLLTWYKANFEAAY